MNFRGIGDETYRYWQTLEKPITRPLIMRALDYPGYVPIIGRIVGIVRVILSVSGALIAELGAKFARTQHSRKWQDRFKYIDVYLSNEALRGVDEIKGLSYLLDKRRKEQEVEGILNRSAYGKYIYENYENMANVFFHGHVYSNTNHEGKGVVWASSRHFMSDHVCKVYNKLTPSQTSTLFNLFQAHSVTGNGLFLTPRDMDRLYDALPKSDQVTRKQKLLDWCFGAHTTIQKLIGSPSPFPVQRDAVSKLPGELEAFIEGLTEPQAGLILKQLRQLMDPRSNSGALRENNPGIIFLNIVKEAVGINFEMHIENTLMCRFLLAAGPACPAVAQGLRAKGRDHETALTYAVLTGRTDMAQALLQVAPPEAKTFLLTDVNWGETAFMRAVSKEDIAMMQTLLDAAADQRARDALLTARNFSGSTSLHIALLHNINPQVVQFLLSAVASSETKRALLTGRDSIGRTALMHAVHKGNLEATNILLEVATSLGPEVRTRLITARDPNLTTAWMYAVHGGNSGVVQALWNVTPLEDRAALNTDRDDEGMTPLMYACTPMMVRFFMDNIESREDQIARLEDQDHMGKTVLMYAAKNNRLELLQELIRVGADFRARDSQGMTALMHAKSQEVIAALLQAGADPLARDTNGMTALMHAAKNDVNPESVIPALLGAGLNLMDQDNEGGTALMHAVRSANVRCMQALLQAASHTQIITTLMMVKDSEGNTAFMHAVIAGNTEIARWLFCALNSEAQRELFKISLAHTVAQGSVSSVNKLLFTHLNDIEDMTELDPDSKSLLCTGQDHRGMTMLMHAVIGGYYTLADDLLESGADPTTLDHQGMTAFMYAVNMGNFEIARSLFRPLSVEAQKALFKTSLAHAVAQGNLRSVKNLWDCLKEIRELEFELADADSIALFCRGQDHQGMTMLMHAVIEGDRTTVEDLLALGANPTAGDHQGRSALMYAEGTENLGIIELLRNHNAQNQERSVEEM